MSSAMLGLRLLLTGVFGVAAIGKLANRAGFAAALADFAVPGWLIAPLTVGLPVLEVEVAVTLLSPVTGWWAACVSLLMLASFTVVVGVALHHGRSPHCACFGAVRSTPIGAHTMLRNATFGLAAAVVVAAGPHGQGPDPLRSLS